MRLIVATTNQGKLREIRARLNCTPVELEGLDAHPEWKPAVEDGDTFAHNARKKAQAIAAQSGELSLADDSGLVVNALDGRPGVHSARFAHANATDAENNAYLLECLQGVPVSERGAAFVCVMALCAPDGECRLFEGKLSGVILGAPEGSGGFGYDPLFWLPKQEKSLAQLALEEKNRISHRGLALTQVLEFLQ
ncbi:MAG: XTP/dITP diphosphatase [Desulfuromonadaceae bacterium]|nr:XTP/dITP diphosphatase [Geobacteraceae bacterium]